ncbi:alanyl-tRNA synthetase-like protein [Leptotrombidium deliense]|uniref:Alanyl-tRNA synthetase-like protein n=1 Tax=Leptotrombidium deliense TaxID=299467 RepID=A0A443SF14_9ACAR|nr:alanyl-tRNA synthetase-like protein [Leptotrombidium deliense]
MFECHRNSYLTKLSAKVTRCEKSVHTLNGKTIDGFNVVLTDTVLFPEGGGQPDDRGTINGKPVFKVRKVNNEAVHFVETVEPLPVGECVEIEVDWNRRWDHMQQHTAQHLISAIAEDEFKLLTTSWTLGDTVSYIEIDASNVESDTVDKLESVVNEKIKDSLSVEIRLYDKNDPELSKVRSRFELPDISERIRVISIKGVDLNTCCGTHVSNLSHLQSIKLLYVEKAKKNKCHLYFVAGQRLLRYLANCVKREKCMTALLKNGPDDHVLLVGKLQKNLKQTQKNCLTVVRDIALLEARLFKLIDPRPKFYSLHRKEGLTDFATIFANEVAALANETFFLVTVAQDASSNSPGYVLMIGRNNQLNSCIPIAEEVLNAKGTIKQDRFQAKVTSLANRSKFEERLKSVLLFD